ncbi:Fic family protein [Lactobacillus helsingborgensis]|nr:Fic family protein [Lactobacillus helsingborgensis]
MSDWIKDTLYDNGVMKNKQNIKNQQKLEDLEYLQSSRRAFVFLSSKPKISDIRDLKKIHKIMFGKLYDWAGKYRPGNFQKNGYEFFDHSRFGYAEKNINDIIHGQPKQAGLAATDYAKLLDEINFMHPFREGNCQSCKVFLLAYAANHGQVIDYPRKNEEMIAAQENADVKQISSLIKIQNLPSRDAAFKLLTKQMKTSKDLNQNE